MRDIGTEEYLRDLIEAHEAKIAAQQEQIEHQAQALTDAAFQIRSLESRLRCEREIAHDRIAELKAENAWLKRKARKVSALAGFAGYLRKTLDKSTNPA